MNTRHGLDGQHNQIQSSITGNAEFADSFPLLKELRSAGSEFHYLDNAATTHKPEVVINAISDCYRHSYGPVHRGLYPLAETASGAYEHARERIAQFIGAPSADEIIFTRSATEAINLVARGWANRLDETKSIWVSRLEHHANYLPWQSISNDTGAPFKLIELAADGSLDLAGAEGLFSSATGLIAITLVSNVLGTIQPIQQLIADAHAEGIVVLVDASQAVGHIPVSVTELKCDFLVFSGHKMYGPTGIGILYGRRPLLEQTEPLLLGGGMVDWVGEYHSQWSGLPQKFEAGSPNLAGAVGLAAATSFLSQFNLDDLHRHCRALVRLTIDRLESLPGIIVYAPELARQGSGIVSFTVAGVHPHDIAQIAGDMGVALRAGHHCCQPLMTNFGLAAMVRVSFAPYNTEADVDALIAAIHQAQAVFA